MTIQYLLDENVNVAFRAQLQRHAPGLIVHVVGDADAPPKQTPDPALLRWCEQQGALLVTDNRRTMPAHLRDHLAEGRHVPGILALRRHASFGRVLEHLILIALVADEGEYRDQIVHIPFPSPDQD